MGLSAWVALSLAVAFSVASIGRVASVINGRGSPRVLWAHLAMVLVLWLAVPPVYTFLDGILGGQNWANLISHLAFAPVIYWGGANVALAIGAKPVADHIHFTDRWVLLGCSVLIIVPFLIADVPSSSMGLDGYLNQPAVVLYKAASFIFPAWVAIRLVRPVADDARTTPAGWQRRAKYMMALGFILLCAIPVVQLAPLISSDFARLTDVLLYPAILFVLLGATLAWIQSLASRRHHPAQ